jgi:hypothetical protein
VRNASAGAACRRITGLDCLRIPSTQKGSDFLQRAASTIERLPDTFQAPVHWYADKAPPSCGAAPLLQRGGASGARQFELKVMRAITHLSAALDATEFNHLGIVANHACAGLAVTAVTLAVGLDQLHEAVSANGAVRMKSTG